MPKLPSIYSMRASPIQDMQDILTCLPLPKSEEAKPAVRGENIQNVLVCWGSGQLEPLLLKCLLRQGKHLRSVTVIIDGEEEKAAKEKFEKAIKPLATDEADEGEFWKNRCTLLVGCLGDELFGLNKADYEKLALKIDAVAAIIGSGVPTVCSSLPSDFLERKGSYYAAVSEKVVRPWQTIIEFCTAGKMKNLWAFSSLLKVGENPKLEKTEVEWRDHGRQSAQIFSPSGKSTGSLEEQQTQSPASSPRPDNDSHSNDVSSKQGPSSSHEGKAASPLQRYLAGDHDEARKIRKVFTEYQVDDLDILQTYGESGALNPHESVLGCSLWVKAIIEKILYNIRQEPKTQLGFAANQPQIILSRPSLVENSESSPFQHSREAATATECPTGLSVVPSVGDISDACASFTTARSSGTRPGSPTFGSSPVASPLKHTISSSYASIGRGLKIPVVLFRLPVNFVNTNPMHTFSKAAKGHAENLVWKLIKAFIQEGLLPSDIPHFLYSAMSIPIDVAFDHSFRFAFSTKRIHWAYNLVEASWNRQSFEYCLKQCGIYLKECKWSDFVAAVHKRSEEQLRPSRALDSRGSRKVTPPDAESAICEDLDMLNKLMDCCRHMDATYSNVNLAHDSDLCFNTPFGSYTGGQTAAENYQNVVIESLQRQIREEYFEFNSLGTLTTPEECKVAALELAGGLTDFGPWARMTEEGWGRFMSELYEPDNPTPATFGTKVKICRTLIVYFTTLLFITAREKEAPEILNQVIKSPIVILGANRTGSTLLHTILSADTTRFRTPILMEMLFPYGEDGSYKPVGIDANDELSWSKDPRRKAAERLVELQMGGLMLKEIKDMRRRKANLPEEEVALFELTGRCYTFCTAFKIPRYAEWLLGDGAREYKKAYSLASNFIKHLNYQKPGKRWIFKMPFHLLCLDELMRVYPDAELIILHRGPVPLVASWAKMELVLQKNYLLNVLDCDVGRRACEVMGRMIDRLLEWQEQMAIEWLELNPRLQPPQSFYINIYFENLIKNPIGQVKRIYQLLDLAPLTLKEERVIWETLEDCNKLKGTSKLLKCQLDEVGLTKRQIRNRFFKYMKLYFDEKEKRLNEYPLAKSIRTQLHHRIMKKMTVQSNLDAYRQDYSEAPSCESPSYGSIDSAILNPLSLGDAQSPNQKPTSFHQPDGTLQAPSQLNINTDLFDMLFSYAKTRFVQI